MNIVEAFLYQARHQPTAVALCVPGTHYSMVSYGRLELIINNIGNRALSEGLKSGQVVAIAARDPVLHLALVLGLTRIGIVTVSVSTRRVPVEIHADAAVTDTPGEFLNVGRVFVADQNWTVGPGLEPAAEIIRSVNDEPVPARIVLTSGTTGDSKAVILSHEMLLLRMQAWDVAFGNVVPTCSRIFLDVGLTVSYGFTWAMKILARGGAIFLRGPDPATTLQAFDLYKIQAMIAAPSGISEFLDYYERSPQFQCPFILMLASGSQLPRSLSERVRARMCSNLVATYGSTEITPVAAAAGYKIANINNAVGYLAPWVEAQAVDNEDRPLTPGREGPIRLRSYTCVKGYIGNPPGAGMNFRNGWFYPGDIGTITVDRMLIISGRQQATMNIGGNKVSPEVIEAALGSFPGVVHCAVFSRPNELGVEQIWAIVTSHDDLDLAAAREHCSRTLPAHFVPAKVLQVRQIPLNDMGKFERGLLPELANSALR